MKKAISLEDHYAKLKRLQDLHRHYAFLFYRPYEKQRQFHDLGRTKRERMFMAGNRLGKTYAAGNETTFHATGLYPDDWTGRRFERSTRGWVGSVTSELTRDGAQRILLGPIGKWGTGCIPKDLIVEIKRSRGVPDAVETILVKHLLSGDISQITFKAYSDTRESWQAEELDWLWFDEEPPMPIYMEGLTRTNNTLGPVYLTFTPLLGMSQVVMRFLKESSVHRAYVQMTIDDAGHYTPEARATIIAQYAPHEREARARGVPMQGSGLIFPVAHEMIEEAPLPYIPSHWKQVIGMDFGWEHPTAAVRLAYDADNDCVHVTGCYRQKEQLPLIHAAAIKPWGQWIPVAWPPDATIHDKGSGEQVKEQYRAHGLKMLSEHASFPDDRGRSVEASCLEILERMQTGRFKVNRMLSDWFEEVRMYHREEGKVFKLYDDLMDATRYGVMMLRYAVPEMYAPKPRDRYAVNTYGEGTWMSS